MAEHMVDSPAPKAGAKTKPKPAPSPPKKKLSKKERLKQELMGHVGGNQEDVAKATAAQEREKELQAYEQQAEQIMGQILKRAKLGPSDKLTLREFCDIMWRGGNASPLDEDDPVKEDEDDDEEEEAEESDSLAD